MVVTKELNDFWAVYDNCWGYAKDILDDLHNKGVEDEVMQVLNDVFYEPADEYEVNDFIHYELEDTMKEYGFIKDDEDEEDEEEW